MRPFRFMAARSGEPVVHGAERPGYPAQVVEGTRVSEWIAFMQQKGTECTIFCVSTRHTG
jgi:hypothetical protein